MPVRARAAGCVILNARRQLLLVQQARSPLRGLWHLPMGRVEDGETPQEAAVREAREETGLQVDLVHFLDAYLGRYDDGGRVQRFVWLARALPGELLDPTPDAEIMDRRYFDLEDFEALYAAGQVRMHHTRLALHAALELLQRRPDLL
nr:NUDIX domain-containing protein [Deinobacterium chartae]